MRGVVVDAVTEVAVPGALLRVSSPERGTLTDVQGAFLLPALPAGFVELRVEAVGYVSITLSIDPSDVPQPLRIGLVAEPFELEGLDVEVAGEAMVTGRIVDAVGGDPLVGATVRESSRRRARPVLSRDDGSFRLPDVRVGPSLIEFSHLGYTPQMQYLVVPPVSELEIALEPDSLILARVAVIEAKAEWERRAIATMPVQTLDRRRVASRPWVDTRALLARLGIYMESCPIDGGLTGCRRVGGELKEVELCIDGRQAFGGLAELDSYRPTDIHLIESFDRGEILRVTTVQHMERMASRERPLPTLCRDPTLG